MNKFFFLFLTVFSVCFMHSQSASFVAPGVISLGDFDIPGNKFTIEAIIRTTNGGGNIVSKHTDPTNLNYLFRAQSAEYTTYNTGTSGATTFYNMGNPFSVSNNIWYHVASTYDGTTARYFINGCEVHNIPVTGNMMQNNVITSIGGYGGSIAPFGTVPGEYWNGEIDELRIWNVVRTQAQIEANMNDLPSYATEAGLLSYFKFNSTYTNLVTAGPNGIASGGVSFGPEHPTINTFAIDSVITVDGCGNTGSLTIYANFPGSQFSLDGITYGASATFGSLAPNTYAVYARSPFGCVQSQTVTINPSSTPTVSAVNDTIICSNALISLPAFIQTPGTATANWTNSNPAIGLSASGSGDLPSFTATNTGSSAITATITVTPVDGACTGTPITFDITVNPTPNLTPIADTNACAGSTLSLPFSNTLSGSSYAWTNTDANIGLPTNGTDSVLNFTVTNTTASNINGTLVVNATKNGCTSNTLSFIITAKPIPTNSNLNDTSFCAGENVAAIAFNEVPGSAITTWTNSNPSIGLGASGSNSLSSFTATNTGSTDITGTISYQTSLNGCSSASKTFTINVRATPIVNPIGNYTWCAADLRFIPPFTSSISGASFTWTNDNTSTGIGANGIGDIGSFFVQNNTTSPIVSSLNVVANNNGCTSVPVIFTVTAKPKPYIQAIPDTSFCEGSLISLPPFVVTPSNSAVSWSNSNPTIGLAANGNGNLPSFTTSTDTIEPLTSNVLINASLNGCNSFTEQFSITIKPKPQLSPINDTIICAKTTLVLDTFSSNTTNTNYTWANSANSIGLASSGTGNLLPFAVSNNPNTVVAQITVIGEKSLCYSAPETFTITVNPQPTFNQYADIIACQEDEVSPLPFSVSPANANINWINNNNNDTYTGTGNLPNFIAVGNNMDTNIGNFKVIAEANACISDTMYFSISVKPKPLLYSVSDSILCALTTVNLPAFGYSTANATISWTNSNPNIGILDNGMGSIPPFTTPYTGSDTLKATITVVSEQDGCFSTPESMTLTVQPNELETPMDENFCIETTIRAPANYVNYLWNTGETDASITLTEEGLYSLTTVDSSLCVATKSFFVNQNCVFIYIPSAFTPNADGFNEVFKPAIDGTFESYSFEIYDRWGNKIFATTDTNEGWDGTHKNEPAKGDTYSYRLKYDAENDIETRVKIGHFLLMR